MKRTTLLFLLAAAVSWAAPTPGARAQQTPTKAAGVNVIFKDGKQVLATGFRSDTGVLLVTQQVANGTGEIGYPLASIDTVQFPEPAQLAGATALLAQGKDSEALAQIDPITTFYGPFRYVPGNWWLPAALIRADALAGLKRERDVDALLGEVAKLPNNPDAVEAARLRSAEALSRRGNAVEADKVFDALIKTSTDDDTLARAWVGRGRVLLERREFEPALLAYLHVPVFYPDDRRSMADALLGSGRAFVGIDNRDKARQTFQQIISDYPSTPDANAARAELQKIEPPKPAT